MSRGAPIHWFDPGTVEPTQLRYPAKSEARFPFSYVTDSPIT
ncbi:hypothetical protein ACFLSG_03325 [Candidatus Bipolaricaulota bacterium]